MTISSLQSKHKLDPKKDRSQSSGDDVVWPSSCLSLSVLTPSWCCVLMYSLLLFFIFIFLQVEVHSPTTGRTSEEEVVTASSTDFPSMEEEAPGGGITEEVGQPMQGIQSPSSTIPLATQDPEASQPPVSQDPQLWQTFSPIKTVSPDPTLNKEPLGAHLHLYKQVSPHSSLIKCLILSLSFFFFF